MLKNKRLLMCIMVLSLLVTTFILTSTPAQSSTYNLSLAHFFPATHPVETILLAGWTKDIEEATDGRVVITTYPGQTLLNANETYGGVVSGIADIGLSCFAYTRGRFPVLEVFELPGITYLNSSAASSVAWEGIQKLDPDEIQDTRLLMVFATGPGHLLTNTPIRGLDDLQGVEIRTTGSSAQTLDALGATPVAMPQSETYEALSRGIVDGNLSPIEVLKGWRHAEVTKYLTYTPFLYNTLFFITANLDLWNSLPEDIQEIIEEVNERHFEEVARGLWDFQNKEALTWATEETEQEIIELPEDEINRWIELVEPIQKDYIEKIENKDLPGDEYLETVQELAEKYNAEFSE